MNPFTLYHQTFQKPRLRWILVILTIIYLLSPIDLIPDFIFPFGLIDDTVLIVMLIIEILLWLINRPKPKIEIK